MLGHFGEQRSPGGFYTGRVRFDLKKQQGKKSAALDGGEPGYNPNITGVSSATPVSSISTAGEKVNKGMETDPKRIEAEAITQMLINDWAMKLREEAEGNDAYAEAGTSGGLVYDEYVRDNLDSTTAEKIHSAAKMLGTRVRFVDNVRNGTANAQINGREILVEKNNPNPVMFLLGHEWTHRIQELAPAEYRAFREAAAEETQGEARILLEAYREAGEAMDYEAALDEAAANYAGRMIEDGQVLEEFIQRHRQDRTLLERVRDALRQLADKLSGEYRRMAQTAEGRLAAALEEAARQAKSLEGQDQTAREGGDTVRFSLKKLNGKHVVWIENSALTNRELKNYAAVANYIAQHIGEVYTIVESGQKVYIGKDLPKEYTHSGYTKYLINRAPKALRAKNRAIGDLGLLIETATNRRWEQTKHTQSKDAKFGMYRYDSCVAFPIWDDKGNIVNVQVFDVELLIRNASDGKKYLYDIVGIKENATVEIDLLQREARKGSQMAASQRSVSNK